MLYRLLSVNLLLFLAGCTTTPPQHTDNACLIFAEQQSWYDEAKDSFDKWGVPIHVMLAIIHQESRFVADARPPRPKLLGIIPWFRSSSAYGYAQAQDETWSDYQDHPDSHWSADRDDFADACDFIGWYCSVSRSRLGISLWDTEKLYLAYHEGHNGYRRKTFASKPRLIKIAQKVARQSRLYRSQLATCQKELNSNHWFF
jgi:hypothetical protein